MNYIVVLMHNTRKIINMIDLESMLYDLSSAATNFVLRGISDRDECTTLKAWADKL